MPFHPDRTILFNIHQIPGWERKRIEIRYIRPPSDERTFGWRQGRPGCQSKDISRLFSSRQLTKQFDQRLLPLADQYIVRALFQVFYIVIGSIRTTEDHNTAA